MRNYSIINNPFICGLRHISYKKTNNKCFLPKSENKKNDASTMNIAESGAYYLGRLIRFPVNAIATITYVVLQTLECLALTFEYSAAYIESRIRKCFMEETLPLKLQEKNISLAKLFETIRSYFPHDSLQYFAQDLCLINETEICMLHLATNKYNSFLCKKFGIDH